MYEFEHIFELCWMVNTIYLLSQCVIFLVSLPKPISWQRDFVVSRWSIFLHFIFSIIPPWSPISKTKVVDIPRCVYFLNTFYACLRKSFRTISVLSYNDFIKLPDVNFGDSFNKYLTMKNVHRLFTRYCLPRRVNCKLHIFRNHSVLKKQDKATSNNLFQNKKIISMTVRAFLLNDN